MNKETYLVGLIFVVAGIVFIYNHKNMAKRAFRFYQKLYTEKNLSVMFRVVGVLLALGGIFLMFFK